MSHHSAIEKKMRNMKITIEKVDTSWLTVDILLWKNTE